MRILIHGQQAFGKAVLERLMAGPDEVVGVLCLPDREGSPPGPLKEAGLERGLKLYGSRLGTGSTSKSQRTPCVFVFLVEPQCPSWGCYVSS